eukprot:1149592-Pelagomonas_calceolata.AAC.3
MISAGQFSICTARKTWNTCTVCVSTDMWSWPALPITSHPTTAFLVHELHELLALTGAHRCRSAVHQKHSKTAQLKTSQHS